MLQALPQCIAPAANDAPNPVGPPSSSSSLPRRGLPAEEALALARACVREQANCPVVPYAPGVLELCSLSEALLASGAPRSARALLRQLLASVCGEAFGPTRLRQEDEED